MAQKPTLPEFSAKVVTAILDQNWDSLSLLTTEARKNIRKQDLIATALHDNVEIAILHGDVAAFPELDDALHHIKKLRQAVNTVLEHALPLILGKKDYARFNRLYDAFGHNLEMERAFNSFQILKAGRQMLADNHPGDFEVLRHLIGRLNAGLQDGFDNLHHDKPIATLPFAMIADLDPASTNYDRSQMLTVMFTEKGAVCQDPRDTSIGGLAAPDLVRHWRKTIPAQADALFGRLKMILSMYAAAEQSLSAQQALNDLKTLDLH